MPFNFVLPTQRGNDAYGSGYYGAPRGSRKHQGLDLFIVPGFPVYAPRSGKVKRTAGVPYAAADVEHQHYKYVSIIDEDGFEHILMYVKAAQGLKKGQLVRAGDVLGYAQDLHFLYPGIRQHVHYEVTHGNKKFHPLDFATMKRFLSANRTGKMT